MKPMFEALNNVDWNLLHQPAEMEVQNGMETE